jgi:hypothetical protein
MRHASLLGGHVATELGLSRPGIAELVAVDGRDARRRADDAYQEWEEEEERAETTAEAPTPG